ncbi:hypothetical protein LTS09_009888 [Friedmanniomyces endolithicus]|nr:hypothetical protein LTS09_009888 [Friedmanniomyces endolithicus]
MATPKGLQGQAPKYKQPCFHFARGECAFGEDKCRFSHHANLSPEVVPANIPDNHRVPATAGVACQRCIIRMYECDKLTQNRAPGGNDPCSECRWFGGPDCDCTLTPTMNYNDSIWGVMFCRGAKDHTLPDDKPRTQGTAKSPTTSEMPSENLVPDWDGLTKEALLAKPDYLPAGMRDCPRAFLTIPGVSRNVAKAMAHNEEARRSAAKRKADTEPTAAPAFASAATSASVSAYATADAPAFPLVAFAMPPPPPCPVRGPVTESGWSVERQRYFQRYANGAVSFSPEFPAPKILSADRPRKKQKMGDDSAAPKSRPVVSSMTAQPLVAAPEAAVSTKAKLANALAREPSTSFERMRRQEDGDLEDGDSDHGGVSIETPPFPSQPAEPADVNMVAERAVRAGQTLPAQQQSAEVPDVDMNAEVDNPAPKSERRRLRDIYSHGEIDWDED